VSGDASGSRLRCLEWREGRRRRREGWGHGRPGVFLSVSEEGQGRDPGQDRLGGERRFWARNFSFSLRNCKEIVPNVYVKLAAGPGTERLSWG